MKKIIPLFLILLVLAFSINVSAANKPSIKIEPLNVKAGQSIKVPVKISNNPGIWAIKFQLRYDKDIFEYKKHEIGEVFSKEDVLMGPTDKDVLTFTAEYHTIEENNTSNGTLVTYYFKVKENVPNGSYKFDIILDLGSTIDNEANEIAFDVQDGFLNVSGGVQSTTIPKITDKQGAVINTDADGNLVAVTTDEKGSIITTEPITTEAESTVKPSEISPKDNKTDNDNLTGVLVAVAIIILIIIVSVVLYLKKNKKV